MAENVTVEWEGVEVEVDPSHLADPRFTYCLTRVSDDTVRDEQRLKFYGRMLSVLFGEDGAYSVMCSIADALGSQGREFDPDAYNAFFSSVLEQLNAKNS